MNKSTFIIGMVLGALLVTGLALINNPAKAEFMYGEYLLSENESTPAYYKIVNIEITDAWKDFWLAQQEVIAVNILPTESTIVFHANISRTAPLLSQVEAMVTNIEMNRATQSNIDPLTGTYTHFDVVSAEVFESTSPHLLFPHEGLPFSVICMWKDTQQGGVASLTIGNGNGAGALKVNEHVDLCEAKLLDMCSKQIHANKYYCEGYN